jgi:hypothetical protein
VAEAMDALEAEGLLVAATSLAMADDELMGLILGGTEFEAWARVSTDGVDW